MDNRVFILGGILGAVAQGIVLFIALQHVLR